MLLLASMAAACGAPQRVFVASYGNDINPCSIAQPCRTLAAAVNAVAAGGEVVPRDSAEYGPLTIDKSLSVVVPDDVAAFVTTTDETAVNVSVLNAGKVKLHGLRVRVNWSLRDLNYKFAIRVSTDYDSSVEITNVTASSPGGYALGIHGGNVSVSDTRLWRSHLGAIVDNTKATFKDVVIDGGGIELGNASLEITRSSIWGGNGGAGGGIYASASKVHLSLSDSLVAFDLYGLRMVIADSCDTPEFRYGWAGVSRSTIVGNSVGAKFEAGLCHATTAATMTDNLVVDNGDGIVAAGTAHDAGLGTRLVVGGNTLTGNAGPAITLGGTASAVYTRGNNAILQSVPVSGTLTPIPAY